MPVQLLPASAAAFAPRASSVNVVLGTKIEPWLTQTLKRVSRVKRPLNNVPQHQRCLTETLSSTKAIWTLASLMLPVRAGADMSTGEAAGAGVVVVDDLFGYQLLHVEAYIVHVDMILRNEVAFKLTPDTIGSLVDHHARVHCVDVKASTYPWAERDRQCEKLHEDFVQAVNRFVYRTHVAALEGMEEDGAGELLAGKSEEVKNSLMGLLKPLLPPPPPPPPLLLLPPRLVDVVRQAPLLPGNALANAAVLWSQPAVHGSPPADPWRLLPSSPSLPSSTCPESAVGASVWTTALPAGDVSMSSSPIPALYFVEQPPHPMPLPSMIASSQCGVGIGGGFSWHRWQDYPATM